MSNEPNITMDEARALVSDQALWPLIRDFLWDFEPQIHASWLEGLISREAFGNLESLMANPRVKAHVLAQLDVGPCFHAFPKGDWSRLILLDGATLEHVAKWLGALVCADDMRRVTDGKTVRELKAELAGIYPEVFGYTMYFNGMEIIRSGAETQEACGKINGESVAQVGAAILFSLTSALPESLLNRFRLKFPKELCAFEPMRETKKQAEKVQAVVMKLLKLKFPEAYNLCC